MKWFAYETHDYYELDIAVWITYRLIHFRWSADGCLSRLSEYDRHLGEKGSGWINLYEKKSMYMHIFK